VAEITVQVAAIFIAEMVVASRHAHDFAAFGKAQALGRPFMGFHLWHFSLLIFTLLENKPTLHLADIQKRACARSLHKSYHTSIARYFATDGPSIFFSAFFSAAQKA